MRDLLAGCATAVVAIVLIALFVLLWLPLVQYSWEYWT